MDMLGTYALTIGCTECGAPIGVRCAPECTSDEATRCGEPTPVHVDYPHHPGYLYDCPGREDGPCVCEADPEHMAPCLSSACERN